MCNTFLRSALFVLAIALLTSPKAGAELPPGSYDKLRSESQEAVIFEAVKVTSSTSGFETRVTVEGKLLAVERSKAKLKPGERITIEYTTVDVRKARGFAGPRQAAVLKQGTVYPAFLNKHDNQRAFSLAAYGASFEMTPEKSRGEP